MPLQKQKNVPVNHFNQSNMTIWILNIFVFISWKSAPKKKRALLVSIKDFFQKHLQILLTPNFWTVVYVWPIKVLRIIILKLSVLCLMSVFFPLSGVLLLNSVLTVRAHQPTSHEGQGWEIFTDAVVLWLSRNLNGLVFLLWGSYAQRKGRVIDRVSSLRQNYEMSINSSGINVHLAFFKQSDKQNFFKTYLKNIDSTRH